MLTSGGIIPVLIISGFLGSGKTTLIRHLLGDPRLGEVAVIVNEFGEVGIDHHLVRKTDERTTLLRNGCICCTMRDDLADALRDLLGRRDRGELPDLARVVIETTGLADPVPILQTILSEPVIRNHFRIERVVATIDAVGGAVNLATYGEAVRQVAAADDIVVTKQDLAPPASSLALKMLLGRVNPTASLVDASFGRLDAAALLATQSRPIPTSGAEGFAADFPLPPTIHAAAGRVATRCLLFDRPLNWQMFAVWLTMLLHRHGNHVLRLKGLLNVGPERGPLLLEGIQHVMHAPRHLADWPDADRRSRLVFIVRDLDLAVIERSLTTFQEIARDG